MWRRWWIGVRGFAIHGQSPRFHPFQSVVRTCELASWIEEPRFGSIHRVRVPLRTCNARYEGCGRGGFSFPSLRLVPRAHLVALEDVGGEGGHLLLRWRIGQRLVDRMRRREVRVSMDQEAVRWTRTFGKIVGFGHPTPSANDRV